MAAKLTTGIGNHHSTIAPYGEMLTTNDGKYTMLAVGTDKQFAHLCEALEIPHLVSDARFITNQQRVKHREEMFALFAPAALAFTRDELLNKLHILKVPAGPVRNMQEVFNDPACQKLVLEELVDGILTKRPRTMAFEVK
jgi:crotonobetainyl-CoA:carnitine CoA-transferase CaiB-like acyl-CoA transferase